MEKTKIGVIAEYMRKNRSKGLTTVECFRLCHTYRLPEYIRKLEKKNYVFSRKDEESSGEYGKVIYTRYFIEKTPEEREYEEEKNE